MKKIVIIVLSLCIVAAGLAVFIHYGLDDSLIVRNYTLCDERISGNVRIALISDLHSRYYGENQKEIIGILENEKPDIVALCGDIFDNGTTDENAEALIREVSERYTCFYVAGNHEYWSTDEHYLTEMSIVAKYGVERLSGICETITVNGTSLNICGADDPNAWPFRRETDFRQQLTNAADGCADNCYTVLLSHRPERIKDYQKYPFDLVLCGHAHGGQWRIPGILNGIYAPDQGLFPKYAGGMYEKDGITMIVSRGLATNSGSKIKRFYNHREIVIITLEKI